MYNRYYTLPLNVVSWPRPAWFILAFVLGCFAGQVAL